MNKKTYNNDKSVNQLITYLVLWYLTNKRIDLDTTNGYKPVKNIEKCKDLASKITMLLRTIDLELYANAKSIYPLVDHVTLLNIFKARYL